MHNFITKTRLICPLTSPTVSQMRADMNTAITAGADMVEFRLDLLEKVPTAVEIETLLADVPVDAIATCRSIGQGGRFDGTENEQLTVLRHAAACGAWIDVEYPTQVSRWPDTMKVIYSYHDFSSCPSNMASIATALDTTPAVIGKIAFNPAGPHEALRAFDILRLAAKPTIALAMGEAGVLTRILANKFSAFGTFGALSRGTESAPGQPTLDEFRNLYRWDIVDKNTEIYGVIGCPVAHSMSPAIHNAAFAAVGRNTVYVPLRIEPGAEHFNAFMDALLERPWLDWRGLSVTIPHKENALAYVGKTQCDALARKIGAINTITIAPGGALHGDNTDYAAAIDALCNAMEIAREGLSGRSVAVLGAGGAARAIVAALNHYNADVIVYNRTVSRGEALVEEFGGQAAGIVTAESLDAEIVVNCTPIGMHPNMDDTPLAKIPGSVKVVFDTIYNPIETRLLREAVAAGCKTVSGLEMFVNQAVAQFETWTGQTAPRDVMRDVVLHRLGGKG